VTEDLSYQQSGKNPFLTTVKGSAKCRGVLALIIGDGKKPKTRNYKKRVVSFWLLRLSRKSMKKKGDKELEAMMPP
jgi:hypothetical protein